MHRLLYSSAFIFMLTFPAAAQHSDAVAVLNPFFVCAAITDDDSRLECFDAAVRQARDGRETDRASNESAQTSPAAPAPARTPKNAASGSPPRAAAVDDRPARPAPRPHRPAKREKPWDVGTYRVAGVERNAARRWIITLDNGMRWELTELSRRFKPPEPGDTIEIRRSMMGGRKLYFGKQPSVRVKLQE